MAAGSLSPPGSEFGPCESECQHVDCASTRKLAAMQCIHCDEPIGFDRMFYQVQPDGEPAWSKLAHQSCELAAMAREDRDGVEA